MPVGRRGLGSKLLGRLPVTNAHAESGSRGLGHQTSEFRVTIHNGIVYMAVLLAKDDGIDVAVFKIGQTCGQWPQFSLIGMGIPEIYRLVSG